MQIWLIISEVVDKFRVWGQITQKNAGLFQPNFGSDMD